uniref:Uncharacterized protein n=1 Tax=Knipowitschia caucasica TaxID=637954 RepID=A0AAV2J7E9_KNICA
MVVKEEKMNGGAGVCWGCALPPPPPSPPSAQQTTPTGDRRAEAEGWSSRFVREGHLCTSSAAAAPQVCSRADAVTVGHYGGQGARGARGASMHRGSSEP